MSSMAPKKGLTSGTLKKTPWVIHGAGTKKSTAKEAESSQFGTVMINGGELTYRLYPAREGAKQGVPFILVHGWCSVIPDWFSLPAELAQAGHPVLVFDNRGIGQSANHKGKITAENLASDTLALADQLLTKGPFAIIGHSMGVFVAQHLAVHSPERIAAAVFVCGQGAKATAQGGDKAFFKLGMKTWSNADDVQAREQLLGYFYAPNFQKSKPWIFSGVATNSLKEVRPKETVAAQLAMLGGSDYGPHLSKIKCPVLVVHGADDQVIPVGNAQLLHDDLTGSPLRRLKLLPGCHFPMAQGNKPKQVSKEVLAFMNECEEQPRSKL